MLYAHPESIPHLYSNVCPPQIPPGQNYTTMPPSPEPGLQTPTTARCPSSPTRVKPIDGHPSRAYYHYGIGGAGNYHKVGTGDKPVRQTAIGLLSFCRFLRDLFFSSSDVIAHHSPPRTESDKNDTANVQSKEGTSDNDQSFESGSREREVPLGMAEMLKRKMKLDGSLVR